MELDLQSLFGLLCPAVFIGWGPATLPLPPHLGSYTRALLVTGGQPRSLCKPLIHTFLFAQAAEGDNGKSFLVLLELRRQSSVSCTIRVTATVSYVNRLKSGFWIACGHWSAGGNARVHIKGVGPGMTLAWPGWKQSVIAVEVDTGWLETSRFKKCCTNCIPSSLVLNSRVLLMYTDTVEELPGYPVQNSPSGSFLFWRGSEGVD